jgi:hypothetical protein
LTIMGRLSPLPCGACASCAFVGDHKG